MASYMVQERCCVLRDGCGRRSIVRLACVERHKAPQQRGLVLWRDPDSNWGHHDFQSSMQGPACRACVRVFGRVSAASSAATSQSTWSSAAPWPHSIASSCRAASGSRVLGRAGAMCRDLAARAHTGRLSCRSRGPEGDERDTIGPAQAREARHGSWAHEPPNPAKTCAASSSCESLSRCA